MQIVVEILAAAIVALAAAALSWFGVTLEAGREPVAIEQIRKTPIHAPAAIRPVAHTSGASLDC